MSSEPLQQHTAVPELWRHAHGITAIDAGYVRPRQDALHLIVERGRAAFVDTGTLHSVPRALAALDASGLAPEAVDYVLLTHVHLDHAGGAGALVRELPHARVVVHPRGAAHLVDPAALESASIAVYGESAYRQLYGRIVPIAQERLVVTSDGQRIALAGRELELLHTPGHALHHQCIVDHGSGGIFAGDTFGVSYRELDDARGRAFVVPTTTPTQFDPGQLRASIHRLLERRPEAIYLTHYSRVGEVERLGAELELQIQAFADLALAAADVPADERRARIRDAMRNFWIERLAAHGRSAPQQDVDTLLETDLELNTDGLLAWLQRRKRA